MSKKSDSIYEREKRFLICAKEVHGERYDYSKVDYINNKTKIIIICKNHGDFFQRPDHHISNHGCNECGRMVTETKRKISNESVDKKINLLNKQVKRIGNIKGSKIKVMWECIEDSCKMQWLATPNSVINTNNNCPYCHNKKYSELNGILYLVRFTDRKNKKSFLKLGISKDTVKRRFHSYTGKYMIDEIHIIPLTIWEAYKIEQKMLLEFNKYNANLTILFRGKTECFVDSVKIKNKLLEQMIYYAT